MGSSLLCLFALVLVGGVHAGRQVLLGPSYDKNYNIMFGKDHVLAVRQGKEVRLAMDKSTGSGIASKLNYSSGLFEMKIKVPNGNSAGVVTAFYLTSHSDKHDELDFEFLGNVEGQPVYLQTNIFVEGQGSREQKIQLWFDPTADFHTYSILWNPYQIVWFVDNTPIRVFNNMKERGVPYPSQPMQVLTTLWDGEDWATDDGKIKTNWTQPPFKAYLEAFDIKGCPTQIARNLQCYNNAYWWNREQHRKLNLHQQHKYEAVRKTYMIYDYCVDTKRYPTPPADCPR